MAPIGRTASAFALLCACVATSPAALAKPPVSESAAVDAVIEARQPDIRQCALQHAILKGASKVELKAKLLVNGGGQVMGCQVTAKLDSGSGKAVEECVQKVMYATRFPKSSNTLRNVLRNWKFATQ